MFLASECFDPSHCSSHPVLGPDPGSQMGCALTHCLIGHRLLNRLREFFGRQLFPWNGRRPHAQFRDALPPEWLIAKEGHHDGRHAGPEPGGRGPGPRMAKCARKDDALEARSPAPSTINPLISVLLPIGSNLLQEKC